jgi:L-alanine-DL-glutamate epimerase-like enolase superfamily enzyme
MSGLSGLGEAAANPAEDARTLSTLIDWLKIYEAAIAGADALNINVLHQMMDRASGQHPPGCQAARAAIDMAVHDLIAKVRGCPVHEILGGAYRTEMQVTARISGRTAEDIAVAARSHVEMGYRGLTIGLGSDVLPPALSIADLEERYQHVLAALEAVGTDISIDADANQSLGNPALVSRLFEKFLAKRFCANLALQQPLNRFDLLGHAALREKLPIPIVLTESVVSAEAMIQIERLGAADRIGLSLERVGGLSNAMRVADICEAAAIGISPAVTSFTGIGAAAGFHLAAALHDPYPVDAIDYQKTSDTLTTGGPEIENGHVTLRNAPGLGIEIDEDMLHALATQPMTF